MNVGVHQHPPASSSMLDHGTQSLKASRSDVARLENEQPKRQKQAPQRFEMTSNVSSPGGSLGKFTSTSRKSRRRAAPPQRFEEFTAEEERSLRAAIENSKRLVAITPELDVDVPEAPIFYPTVEEFADPIAYIKKIAPEGKKFGICLVRPPPGWSNPTCGLNPKCRPFSTKLQSINRLTEGKVFGDGAKYTLPQYKQMADHFKTAMFPHLMPDRSELLRDTKPNTTSHTTTGGAGNGAVSGPTAPTGTAVPTTNTASNANATIITGNNGNAAGTDQSATTATSATVAQAPAAAPGSAIEHPRKTHPSAFKLASRRVEQQYWNIVQKGTPAVRVEYGNDLDTGKYGSGFPRMFSAPARSRLDRAGSGSGVPPQRVAFPQLPATCPVDFANPEYYQRCGWNLNNLPLLPGSLLRHVSEAIEGINTPWLYLGMLFATFAWHNEDNYLYSMNYMHFGEGKTWYGVPGDKAPAFEKALKSFIHDRFSDEPDLLYHLTTMIAPSVLRQNNVPVYKLFQEPGDFVITFPQAYHGGFSHGFNCAEAVNFALADWIPFGRQAVNQYRRMNRLTVLSHEQLMCALGRAAHELSEEECTLVLKEMEEIRSDEDHARRTIQADGIVNSVYLDNDNDERLECSATGQICYLSAVICECKTKEVVAPLYHASLCKCPVSKKCFVFWHRMADLDSIIQHLRYHIHLLQGPLRGIHGPMPIASQGLAPQLFPHGFSGTGQFRSTHAADPGFWNQSAPRQDFSRPNPALLLQQSRPLSAQSQPAVTSSVPFVPRMKYPGLPQSQITTAWSSGQPAANALVPPAPTTSISLGQPGGSPGPAAFVPRVPSGASAPAPSNTSSHLTQSGTQS